MNEDKPLEEVWQWKDKLARRWSDLTLKQIAEQVTKDGKKLSENLRLKRLNVDNFIKIK